MLCELRCFIPLTFLLTTFHLLTARGALAVSGDYPGHLIEQRTTVMFADLVAR